MKEQKDTCKICKYKMHIGDLFTSHVLDNHRSYLFKDKDFIDFIYKKYYK